MGSFFVVLGVLWGRFLVFWELVELIFGAWEALSGFSGSRTCPRDHLGSILECFGAHLGGTWQAFGSSFGVMLQFFGDMFGVPNSFSFRRCFGGDFR